MMKTAGRLSTFPLFAILFLSIQREKPMITGAIKNKVDKIWNGNP
jgi:hypothetical protein